MLNIADDALAPKLLIMAESQLSAPAMPRPSKMLSVMLLASTLCTMNGQELKLPALGYNTWNSFGGDSKPAPAEPLSHWSTSLDTCLLTALCSAVDEQLARQTIDFMVSTGLQKAGYQYFCLDGAPVAAAAASRWPGSHAQLLKAD